MLKCLKIRVYVFFERTECCRYSEAITGNYERSFVLGAPRVALQKRGFLEQDILISDRNEIFELQEKQGLLPSLNFDETAHIELL